MRFEEISSKEDFDEFFFHEKDFGYIDEETFWVDETHKAKYYFADELNYSTAYQLYRKKKGFEMTPYYMFVDNDFSIYYIFSEYHTPFKFVYDKSRRERDFTKKSRLQLLNALEYEDKDYNESFQALFDTKPLVKKFYEEYKVIKTKLSNSLKGLTEDERWFYSQILLDRIIFIYFLQSREIIKKDYLTSLFNNKARNKNFFKEYLQPLFFNAFNVEHPYYEKVAVDGIELGHIPYLNGGLFRKKDVENDNEIKIEDKIWEYIFNLFDSYEWVVEEQQEDAVVLTPSILGHIFEQSITGRKGKGAYYTPAEITEYISMNTIYPHLRDRLNERFGTGYKNITFELLRGKDISEKEIDHVAYLYFNILKELRVLDNACGSGAFLMAAHRILLALYRQCYRILKNEIVFSAENKEIERYGSSDYYFKRVIATHNIYGVDLEEGAVEIAKLRLWLSMISDLGIDNIEPLPNIDYNIMPGNSLIGFVEAPLIEQTTLDSSDTTKQIIKAKGDLLSQYKATTDPNIAETLRKDIERINKKYRDELNIKFHRLLAADYKIRISEEELEAFNPFHWGFEFYDAFDLDKPKEKRGFDIIIGNPPYVFTRGEHFSNIEKKYFSKYIKKFNILQTKSGRNIQSGKLNLFSVFLVRSIETLGKGYRMGYIIPNNILRTTTYDLIRKFLLDSCAIESILDLSSGVFEGVTASTIVIILKKDSSESRLRNRVRVLSNIHSIPKNEYDSHFIKQVTFQENVSHAFNIYLDNTSSEIVKLTHTNTVPLGEITKYIIEGIVGSRKRDVFDEKLGDIYKKFLVGKDINRYSIDFKEKWIRYDRKKLHRARPEEVFEAAEKIIIRRIGGGESNIFAALDKNQFYSFASTNIILLKSDVEFYIEYITVLLNSKFFNWYYLINFTNKSDLTVNISKTYLEHLRIKKIPKDDQIIFKNLCSILIFIRDTPMFNFFDTQILDSLVYVLYLEEKFQQDGIPTNLAELVAPYLVDIGEKSHDKKMAAIKDIYNKITSDEKVMETIEQIKSHGWVKVIEGSN